MSAATLALAGPASGQTAAIPRAHGNAAMDKLPDWSGVWTLGVAGGARTAPSQPKLTPSGQAQMDAFREKQKREGVQQSAQVHCLPPGMPGIMRQPYPIEFLFTPGRVTLFAETYSQARRIYTDGRALPEDPDPQFNGNSIGHWKGDTLYVETIGLSDPVQYVPGVAHGENVKINEKMWLESPSVMRIETTITDPGVLSEPLVSQAAFHKEPTWTIREYVCEENNRLTEGKDGANIDLGERGPDGKDPFSDTDK
ncbi:MAG: hypothetical protein ABIT09_06600 [Croceibacterium sp.]